MNAQPLAIVSTGLVTSVGLNAPTSCAAIRAGLTNPGETKFIDSGGNWIVGHSVDLDAPLRGLGKLAYMGAMAAEECLADVPRQGWSSIPVILCVAERDRPGRPEGLDDRLFAEMSKLLGDAAFSPHSAVVPHGRVSIGLALQLARKLIYQGAAATALIVATDSLLSWPTLKSLEARDRLLSERNSNGFMPGEAASAVMVARPAAAPQLGLQGLGFAMERASIDEEIPLRADGLTSAIKDALADAQCEMHDLDFRITDVSGEQYYFKEAALALSRTLRQRKEKFDIWHPTECIGEVGSAIGPAMLAVASTACHKGYAPGPHVLIHAGNDAGQRTALVVRPVG